MSSRGKRISHRFTAVPLTWCALLATGAPQSEDPEAPFGVWTQQHALPEVVPEPWAAQQCDLDTYRLLGWSRLVEADASCGVPARLLATLQVGKGTSAIKHYAAVRSSVAVLSTVLLPVLFYSLGCPAPQQGPCPEKWNDWAACTQRQNVALLWSAIGLGLATLGTDILAQGVYLYTSGLYEAKRNTLQDSVNELMQMYEGIAETCLAHILEQLADLAQQDWVDPSGQAHRLANLPVEEFAMTCDNVLQAAPKGDRKPLIAMVSLTEALRKVELLLRSLQLAGLDLERATRVVAPLHDVAELILGSTGTRRHLIIACINPGFNQVRRARRETAQCLNFESLKRVVRDCLADAQMAQVSLEGGKSQGASDH